MRHRVSLLNSSLFRRRLSHGCCFSGRSSRRAAANGADTLYELQDRLGVATCCGSCAGQAKEILERSAAGRRGPAAEPAVYIPA